MRLSLLLLDLTCSLCLLKVTDFELESFPAQSKRKTLLIVYLYQEYSSKFVACMDFEVSFPAKNLLRHAGSEGHKVIFSARWTLSRWSLNQTSGSMRLDLQITTVANWYYPMDFLEEKWICDSLIQTFLPL